MSVNTDGEEATREPILTTDIEDALLLTVPRAQSDTESDTEPVDCNKTGKSQKVSEKKVREKQRLDWIKGMGFASVVLTADGSNIESIGGQSYHSLFVPVRAAFCRANNITVPNNKRGKDDFAPLIINHIKAQDYKDLVAQPTKKRKKQNPRTKPSLLSSDGTLYRVANVITSERGRPLYIETRKKLDANDLDQRAGGHTIFWDGLHSLYNEEDSYNEMIDPDGDLIGYGVTVDDLLKDTFVDPILDGSEFKEVVLFLVAHYREARNNKNKSGSHSPFANFINGKPWLLYFNMLLQSVGDRSLHDCVFAELDENTKLTSDSMSVEKNTDRKLYSPRSSTPTSTMKLSLFNAQTAATTAKTEAAKMIGTRNEWDTRTTLEDRLIDLKKKLYQSKEEYIEVKLQVQNSPSDDSIKRKKKHQKSSMTMLKHQYDNLKEVMGYTSPNSDEDSD